jgi:hypothetical protein
MMKVRSRLAVATMVRQARADARAAELAVPIRELRAGGATTLKAIAVGLNSAASRRPAALDIGPRCRCGACWRGCKPIKPQANLNLHGSERSAWPYLSDLVPQVLINELADLGSGVELGYRVNHKKLFRLYREEKLAVRRRGGRKRAVGTRAPMMVPMAPNDRWSLDFVSDQLTCGRRFRVLTVVDDCTRECLALVADTSLSGIRVARELDRLIIERGKPKMVVSDNGSELTSNAILIWADRHSSFSRDQRVAPILPVFTALNQRGRPSSAWQKLLHSTILRADIVRAARPVRPRAHLRRRDPSACVLSVL